MIKDQLDRRSLLQEKETQLIGQKIKGRKEAQLQKWQIQDQNCSDKKKRRRAEAKALSQISQFISYEHALVRFSFNNLVKEILFNINSQLKIQKKAMFWLQIAVEQHLVKLFEDAALCAMNSKRVLVTPKDLNLARRIRGEMQK